MSHIMYYKMVYLLRYIYLFFCKKEIIIKRNGYLGVAYFYKRSEKNLRVLL